MKTGTTEGSQLLKQWKKEYRVEPPANLDNMVRTTLALARRNGSSKLISHQKQKDSGVRKTLLTLAASLLITFLALVAGANLSPTLALTIQQVPILGDVIKVFTIREYRISEENFEAQIKVPELTGLGNQELADQLNKKYLAENQALYDQFMVEMEEIKAMGGGHAGVFSDYQVLTDNEDIFSIVRIDLRVAGSGAETRKFDTIDKKKEILITLPSLFRDDSYIQVISEDIKSQMLERMKGESGEIYWVEGTPGALGGGGDFQQIKPDQGFYINPDGDLVICFDEYEVAPGYMGTSEFVIPADVLAPILAQ